MTSSGEVAAANPPATGLGPRSLRNAWFGRLVPARHVLPEAPPPPRGAVSQPASGVEQQIVASFLKKRGLQAERAPPAVPSQGTEPPLPGGLGRGGGLRETRVLQREICTNAFRDFVFDVETFRNVPCRLTYRIFQGRMSLWVVFASVLPWRGDAAGQQAGSGEAHVWPTRPLLPSPRSPALGRSRPPRAAPSSWGPSVQPAGRRRRPSRPVPRPPPRWAPGPGPRLVS